MADTVGIMRLTARSLLVPKTLAIALLIKEFLLALSTIWADSLFYAMAHTIERPPEGAKKAAR
jgi:hypothetical protein